MIARGEEAVLGDWRVARYASGERIAVRGTLRFTETMLWERLSVTEARSKANGTPAAPRRRRRDVGRPYSVETGPGPGSYRLRVGTGEGKITVLASLTPGGNLLLGWPMEAGNGWVTLPARIALTRDPSPNEGTRPAAEPDAAPKDAAPKDAAPKDAAAGATHAADTESEEAP